MCVWVGFILAEARLGNFVRLMPQLIDTHELGQWQQVSLAEVSRKSFSCARLEGKGRVVLGDMFSILLPKGKRATN